MNRRPLLIALALALAGCSAAPPEPTTCTPKAVESCTCCGGSMEGTRTCANDGSLWSHCQCGRYTDSTCPVDAGVPDAGHQVDAGPPDAGQADAGPSEVDAGCPNPVAYYPDQDGDGYGDKYADPVVACSRPAGYVTDHSDCLDLHPDAHPGQTGWATIPANLGGIAFWDFDCSGTEEQEYTGGNADCGQAYPNSCPFEVLGWEGLTPACGETGRYLLSCLAPSSGSQCTAGASEVRTQGCH